MRRHLTYANAVATLALLFAMSGGALAASHYLISSTHQIKPSVLAKLEHTGIGRITRLEAPPHEIGPGKALEATEPCPHGELAVSGGASLSGPDGVLRASYAAVNGAGEPTGWTARGLVAPNETTGATLSVWADCASR